MSGETIEEMQKHVADGAGTARRSSVRADGDMGGDAEDSGPRVL